MENWVSVDEVLDFAIEEEENAAGFYTELAEKARHKNMREVFLQFASEEMGHRAKLLEAKRGKAFQPSGESVTDLKISDYVTDVSPGEIENYEDALVVAMKKEKAAWKLYSRLAEMVDPGSTRELFLDLAREEAKHKLRFETEYDDAIREN